MCGRSGELGIRAAEAGGEQRARGRVVARRVEVAADDERWRARRARRVERRLELLDEHSVRDVAALQVHVGDGDKRARSRAPSPPGTARR